MMQRNVSRVLIALLPILATISLNSPSSRAQDGAQESTARVLLVAGLPSWEYRMVQRLLNRDSRFVLSCWLQTMGEERPQEGNESISRLPKTAEELSRYEAIIILDPDPKDLSKQWMTLLQNFCRQGGGVLYVAGPKHSKSFFYLEKSSPLSECLPVEFLAEEQMESVKVRPGKLRVVTENQGHPIISLVPKADENSQLWNSMSIAWSFPTSGAKRDTKKLLELDDGTPVIVTQRFGEGKSVFMSHTGNWRLRRLGNRAQHYDQFWINMARYLSKSKP